MQRAALYARFSTDLQSERSVDDQLALCREFAARQGFRVVEDYYDKARSGASILGRDGLLRLMDDARAGAFEIVVVEALDRLSRDQEDLAGLFKRLSFANIEIIAVHDGKADAMQVGIRGLVSTLFLADLKHKIRRGMTGVVRDGRHAGGKAYGYRPTPGQPGIMVVDEDESAVVRRIFAETIAGRGSREIAGGLNRDGIAPPRGATWNASTINGSAKRGHGLLRNPIYAGKLVWNRVRMVRDPDTGKRISRSNDKSEWKEADVPHLALVSQEDFERANAVMEGRAYKQRGGEMVQRPKRLLSGLLRCSHCGGGMSIHDRTKSGMVRIRCSRSSESGICDNDKRYRLDRIETAVIAGLREQLAEPEGLAEYVRAYREERRSESDRVARERGKIERRVNDLTARMERLMSALARGLLPVEAVEDQYAPLDAERKKLRAELELTGSPDAIELHPQAVTRYRDAVNDLAGRVALLDAKADARTIEVFRTLVSSVVVHDAPGGRVEVEVIGRLAALVGANAEKLGGTVVAEDRFGRSPEMMMLQMLVA
jgi:DNA invertase Pin-like site-specific DNA recombinase